MSDSRPNPEPGLGPASSPQLSAAAGVSTGVTSVAMSYPNVPEGAAGEGVLAASPGHPRLDTGDDAEWMLRVRAGDDAAFDYLVQKYRRPIIGFMYRWARNQAVAEELAQEVFLRVYRSRASYQANAKFSTWLYRIAANLAANHARDSKHERAEATVSLDEPEEESGRTIDVADSALTAEQAILRRERLAAIRKQVQALPERQRMAVTMHKYQGMDYRQIGQVLGLSESATKSLLFRAYETLRERLKELV